MVLSIQEMVDVLLCNGCSEGVQNRVDCRHVCVLTNGAFDPKRQAMLLVGGNKAGADQRRFYKRLIAIADTRFDQHLTELQQREKEHRHGKKT